MIHKSIIAKGIFLLTDVINHNVIKNMNGLHNFLISFTVTRNTKDPIFYNNQFLIQANLFWNPLKT